MTDELDRLRSEVDELQASRRRLVLSGDADRRRIERELHDGPQQHLVALAVNLQLALRLVDDDPEAAKELIEQMGRDVHDALDESRALAHRIYPALLETGGLAAALRLAATALGARAGVQVAAEPGWPPEVVGAVYLSVAEALECLGEGATSTVAVREEDRAVVFEVAADGFAEASIAPALVRIRDRVESLGGGLAIDSCSDGRSRVSGSLPLPR